MLLDNSTSGVAYLKNSILKAVYDRNLARLLSTYNETIAKGKGWESVRKRLGIDMPLTTSKEKVVEDIFYTWLRCSDLMKTMANLRRQICHVVHPNMYYSRKVYTESEKALMIFPEVRGPSTAGLAFMESHAEMLEFRGIVSALAMFDDIPVTIYIDTTGHLGKLGRRCLPNLSLVKWAQDLDRHRANSSAALLSDVGLRPTQR